MRRLACLAVGVALTLVSAKNLPGQDDPPAEVQAQDQFFAGNVTAISDSSITVTRTVLGKESTVHTFIITAETHIEGNPKLKSKVTVRFTSGEEGDRAVRIIVRGAPAGKKQ